MPNASALTRFQITKTTIYALLLLNFCFSLLYGTVSEILENVGWLILLGIFEYETGEPSDDYDASWKAWLVMGAHIAAYGLILFALMRYVREQDWLNCANGVLWLLVVGVLAYDVYAPGEYGGLEWRIRNGVKLLLYTGLGGLAIWWGYIGSLLDFWDAALWIVCFLVVELNTVHADKPAAQLMSNEPGL